MFNLRGFLLTLGVFALIPISLSALANDNSSLGENVKNEFGQSTANFKLVEAVEGQATTAGNMGSFTLPTLYSNNIDHSIEINVLPEKLSTYYPFNTGIGEVTYDESFNHHSGSLRNGTSWVPGVLGSALQFDGKDDYVTAKAAEELKSTVVTSWSAWIKPSNVDNVTQDQMILSFQGANNLRLFGRKLFGSYKINDQPTSVSGVTPVENNKWYHVVSTYDGSSLKLYLNGKLEAELSDLRGNVQLDSDLFEVGRWQASDPRYFHGVIDEVKVYSRALSADQIGLEYNANLGGVSSAQPIFSISPGSSFTSDLTARIASDGVGFQFGLKQDRPLTQVGGVAYIPGISGTFSTPQEWAEGVTNGLGFAWINSGLPKWGEHPNYRYSAVNTQESVLTSTNTSLRNLMGQLDLQYRIDVAEDTPTAVYTNTIYYSGVLKP